MMNNDFNNEQRLTGAKAKIRKHLHMVGWLLFAAAIVEWKRWSQGAADDYVFDLSRFKVLVPLALLALVYLWDALGPGISVFTRNKSADRAQLPGWVWLVLFAVGTVVSLLMG